MADDSSSPATVDPNSHKQEQSTPIPNPNPNPNPSQPQQHPQPLDPTKPQIFPPYAPPQIPGSLVPNLPPPPPQFRPGMQFTQVPNYQNPPGSMPYQSQPPPNGLRPFTPMPNGYPGAPPPGVLRYPSPYPTMVRPGFIMRPPGTVGAVPLVQRPPIPGMLGLRPVMPPMIRPVLTPFVPPVEKPQTTIYIGKIATVENEFMMSILEFCGHVISCKRAEDPTTKKPKGFGFYEFESAEGSLRAIRLLTKLTIDGQELLVNVNQATKEYLLKYVEKKIEKAKDNQGEGPESEREKAVISAAPTVGETGKDGEPKSKENIDIANSAVLTDEEREADKEAKEKIDNAIEERSKTNPLPPPPPPPLPADGSGIEFAFKSKDGDSNTDIARIAANGVETSGEHSRPDTSSPDWSKRNDRRSRDRGEKEQEMDRYEREAERERLRKEREHRRKLEDAERAYQTRLRQWERKEREKEKERQYEKEREKERERKRKKEIRYEEEEDEDDDDSRRRGHRGAEERRRRRQREKEDDLADRLREEEEAAEAKRIAEEQKLQQQQLDALRLLSGQSAIRSEPIQTSTTENDNKAALQTVDESVHEHHASGVEQNGSGNEMSMAVDNNSGSEAHAPSKKLGFGLVGSGKRTSVPSVFYEEDEEEAHKDKKMKPLVPIDYSAEEQEAVTHSGSGNTPPPHLALAAEFAKRISSSNPKEETTEAHKHRSKRSHDKPSHREREREKDRDRARDRGDGHGGSTKDGGKAKTPDTKKLMDAKQLIDTIPKTKEELFSYEINWAMYDEHQLHERMRPWISKKIMEFLGEEEATLVDFIVSNTQQHVKASQMLELLQSILDEEAEMFVLKMWRMLIFEIKRVEAGVSR
ncbi:Splicing factor PWI domain-containing protein / RNA recognition motif [Hirschfeldia incana]|nr:Splicing factor PWI domain-containing protein / RNA recognition motif [Hirschfeldia incana]